MDIKELKQAVIGAAFSGVFTVSLVMVLLSLGDGAESSQDEFTVTIEYDCRAVIMSPKSFTEQVIDECRDKVRFLKEFRTPSSAV